MKEKLEKLNTTIQTLLKETTRHLARQNAKDGRISTEKMDQNQPLFYNLAWHTAKSRISDHFLANAQAEPDSSMAAFFLGETFHEFRSELASNMQAYGVSWERLSELFSAENNALVEELQGAALYGPIARKLREGDFGASTLGEDHRMIRDTFRGFAEDVVRPLAERVHRNDETIPGEVVSGLAELGAFGLSIPERYGGFQDNETPDNLSMLVATEELSRGSLAIAGSLVTRPEILSKALLKGGTEPQKRKWLGKIASGEKMVAVAATEPDFGSDVASMKFAAEPVEGGYLLSGVKTWCTFAGYADILMVLARTEKDPGLRHKGLSILIVEKPRVLGHRFEFTQEQGGKIAGSAIPTIGYRGMHSFEVHFEDFFVPAENLIGEEQGRGKGFYLQMEGFGGGRIQTAARAHGVMQAALEEALRYAEERKVFSKPVADYTLTARKLARMGALLRASRLYSHHVARLMDRGEGRMEATLVKFYASKISEWVTREAMQIHGGMGYAEEFAVSRHFVDARVFSIFEGAEEVMALRVCARDLLGAAL